MSVPLPTQAECMAACLSFEHAVTPLACHIFPDGCPFPEVGETWPTPKSRAVVSSPKAMLSLKNLRKLGKSVGFATNEQDVLVVAACATLQPAAFPQVVANSPLTSPRIFRQILRSNLPKSGQSISVFALTKLLPILADHQRIDFMAIIATLHYLTLAVRAGAISVQAKKALSSMYTLFFSFATKPDLCTDAVRLLHAITQRKHVTVYRDQRLYQFYHTCTPEKQPNFASLSLLLQLFSQHDPQGCGNFLANHNKRIERSGRYTPSLAFPDLVWEQNFHQAWNRSGDTGDQSRPPKRQKISSEGSQSLPSIFETNSSDFLSASDILGDPSLTHLMLLSANETTPLSSNSSSAKREATCLKVCLPFMLQQEWYHQSNTAGSNPSYNPATGSDSSSRDSTSIEEDPASDRDSDSHTSISVDDGTLPLAKATSSARAKARLRVVEGLAVTATQTGQIPSQTQAILFEGILPSWDGTAEWGTYLCYDILPCIPATIALGELKSKVLSSLEKLFLYGAPKLRYAIVSSTLTLLLVNAVAEKQSTAITNPKSIQELIQWTDRLLLQGFLTEPGGPGEMLGIAAVDFFQVVCSNVADQCNLLVLPSTAILYQLLLSKSPVLIDRVCQLLVDYKSSFQTLKARQEGGFGESLKVEGLEQVAIFNCVLWDFCSALWNNSLVSSSTISNQQTNLSLLCAEISKGTLLKAKKQDQLDPKISATLSITHGAFFIDNARKFLQSKQHLETDLSKLKGKWKQEYLDYLLEEGGLDGLHAFLTTFIGPLSKRQKGLGQDSNN